MQGKILADGLIGGSDGKRYNFSVEQIKNLENRNIKDIINAEVDFEIDDTEAKSIFVTKVNTMNLTIGTFKVTEDIQAIKIKAYIYVAGLFVGIYTYYRAIVGCGGLCAYDFKSYSYS